MLKRIVIDVDDVISFHKNRDYANAIPNKEVIKKINQLYDKQKYHVTLYTSRGMVSCNGNLKLIIEKNDKILREWLKEHNVHYDELIFGKPIADMYIDDKCMNVKDFLKQEFCELKGGSGNNVTRVGNIVKKETTYEKLEKTRHWNEDSKRLCHTPNIISTLYNAMYMEHIEGAMISDFGGEYLMTLLVKRIVSIALSFKEIKYDNFNIEKHIQILLKNDCNMTNSSIKKCVKLLQKFENVLKENATFCHGDMTLSNLIMELATGRIYFIDPEQDKEASSYLLDLAKLRMSLMGYEQRFGLSKSKFDLSGILNSFDNELKSTGVYDVVFILNYMYIIRLWRYKDVKGKNIVLEMLKEMEGRIDYLLLK